MARDGRTSIDMEYDSPLFTGASVQFANADHAKQSLNRLSYMASVKQVWPNTLVSRPDAKVVWTAPSGAGQHASSQAIKRGITNDTFSPHVMIQVDKLHAKGITGKNVTIAVIDTGVDYTLPALGGCIGPNCLVTKGYDFVGDAYNGSNTPVPDNDPLDKCEGHGTHVSGIIAARENEYGFTGVAPDVKLHAYRVFGCNGSTGQDVLLAAYLRAHKEGANIITLSLGFDYGWGSNVQSIVLGRLVAQGIIVTASAGNSGDHGLFFPGAPADGDNIASIASFDNTITPWLQSHSQYAIGDSPEEDFAYAIGSPQHWGGVKLPLWTLSFNTSEVDMGCNPFPKNTPDLSKKIVVLRRGTCKFTEKIINAMEYNATYFMFYNNIPGSMYLVIEKNITSVGVVESAVGEKWVKALAAGKTVTLDMSDPEAAPIKLVSTPNNLTGGGVSEFSSWGPTFAGDLKPQFGTPGGDILSTYPSSLGSYAVLQGTSMSCPMAAGIYALLAEARDTFDPILLQNVLAATAKPAPINIKQVFGKSLAPVAQQGAGLLQAYDAAYAVTVLSKSSLSFNDSIRLVDKTFTITNTGPKPITYDLDVIGAATAYTFSNTTKPDKFPGLYTDDNHATVQLSTYQTTVPAGGKCNVTVKVTPPQCDTSRLPVYGGYIRLNATSGEKLSLPYSGIAGDISSHVVLNSTITLKRGQQVGDDIPITRGVNSTFLLTHVNGTINSVDELPAISYELVFGSPLVHVEILSVSNYSSSVERSLGDAQQGTFPYYPRTNDTFYWIGKLKDNSTAPAGDYKFRIRAMRMATLPEENRFDTVTSDKFTIRWR
ncbi:minor extracellular protease vpr [Pyrenophora seminiperda CCB06]|uniref:Minor extracellular protease vpr n=1 Tax=Pyrenophora seminiperda CCB06 TaxID=1302712 RepID=A0A3M7MD06_9PLEO|nr:minor extracellular protease vpr [Pyrenophora seminiperda CCB06]